MTRVGASSVIGTPIRALAKHEAMAVRERAAVWSAMVEQFGKHYSGFEAYVAQPVTSAQGAGQGR